MQKHIDGAWNMYFGAIKGFSSLINIQTPDFVYHYTTREGIEKILYSGSLRFYSVKSLQKKDAAEGKIKFPVEENTFATITGSDGSNQDLNELLRNELPEKYTFACSASKNYSNSYLWENYASEGHGACIRISTKKYINWLNRKIDGFDSIPDYLKCCYVAYDPTPFNYVLERIAKSLKGKEGDVEMTAKIVRQFYSEHLRNLVKGSEFSDEKEYRLFVMDSYPLFLSLCGILAKWGRLVSSDPQELSQRFLEEKTERDAAFDCNIGRKSDERGFFIEVPIIDIADGLILGPKCDFSKDQISHMSCRSIKKGKISRYYELNQ